MTREFLLAALLALAVPLSGLRAETEETLDPLRHEIQRVIAAGIQEHHVKACIAVFEQGEGKPRILISVGDSMQGVPASTDMNFRLGAISIPYITSILLQLADEEVLSLEDPVGKWLPELELPKANEVTLRMLANCTSGYPDYVPDEAFQKAFYADVFRQISQQELLDFAFANEMPHEPGKGWTYAHTNFVLLGKVLSAATGKPLAELIEKRIIGKFGLPSAKNPDTPAIPKPVLHTYTRERGKYEEGTFWNPSWTLAEGAIMTGTLEDCLVSARAIGTGKGISEEALEEMLAPTTIGMGPWNEDRYFGLGVVVTDGWVVQTPSFHGFFGLMAYLPEKDLSLAIYTTKLESAEIDPNPSLQIFQQLAPILAANSGSE